MVAIAVVVVEVVVVELMAIKRSKWLVQFGVEGAVVKILVL